MGVAYADFFVLFLIDLTFLCLFFRIRRFGEIPQVARVEMINCVFQLDLSAVCVKLLTPPINTFPFAFKKKNSILCVFTFLPSPLFSLLNLLSFTNLLLPNLPNLLLPPPFLLVAPAL